MTFQNRHLLEEDYGQGNKMKYLTGGLAGAGLTAASHIMGDGDEPSALDNMKDAHQDGGLWNHIMGKGQEGLGWLKSDNSGGSDSSVNEHQTQTPTGVPEYTPST